MGVLEWVKSFLGQEDIQQDVTNSGVGQSGVMKMDENEAAAKPTVHKPYWREPKTHRLRLHRGYVMCGTGIWDQSQLCTNDLDAGDIVFYTLNKKLVKITEVLEGINGKRYKFRYQKLDKNKGELVDERYPDPGKTRTSEELGCTLGCSFFAYTLDALVVDSRTLTRERALLEKRDVGENGGRKNNETTWVG